MSNKNFQKNDDIEEEMYETIESSKNGKIDFDKYIEQKNENLERRIIKNQIDQQSSDWTENKFETLSNWMKIAAFYIQIIDKCINRYKSLLKSNTIINMILSTLSGTISVFNYNENNYSVILNTIFTSSTFAMAIYSGYIKIDQIQEKLEEFIKIKQDWTAFSAALSSELVIPLNLRQSSVVLINRYKSKFLDLIKTDLDYPRRYKLLIRQEGYSLSQIINTFIDQEDIRLKERSKDDIPKEELQSWTAHLEYIDKLKKDEHKRLYIEYDDYFRVYHRENKAHTKKSFQNLKPRELTDKLYEEYQKLMFNVKKDSNYFLKFYNYIALAIEERIKQQQFIDQEYNMILNEFDTSFSTYVLHNWYKEFAQNPQKKPFEITKILKDKFYNSKTTLLKVDSVSQQNELIKHNENIIDINYWNNIGQIYNSLRSTLIREGPASFIYFITDFSGELFNILKQKNTRYDKNKKMSSINQDLRNTITPSQDLRKTIEENDLKISEKAKISFIENYSKLSVDDKKKLVEHFVTKIRDFLIKLHNSDNYIEEAENTTRNLFISLSASQSASIYSFSYYKKYFLKFSNDFFENIMFVTGNGVKFNRELLKMHKNPFYRILFFQGFDPFILYPEFSYENIDKDILRQNATNVLVDSIMKKYNYNIVNEIEYSIQNSLVYNNYINENINENVNQNISDSSDQEKNSNDLIEHSPNSEENIINTVQNNSITPLLTSESNSDKSILFGTLNYTNLNKK